MSIGTWSPGFAALSLLDLLRSPVNPGREVFRVDRSGEEREAGRWTACKDHRGVSAGNLRGGPHCVSECSMIRVSKIVLVCVEAAILTAALATSFTARAGEVEKSPRVAETPRAGGSDANAVGKSRLLGPEIIAEGRNAMNEIFKRRHSVRSFQPRNVSRRDLEAILAAADSAPSAGGLKSREVLVVTDDVTKRRLVEAAHGQDFVAQAPVVLVFWAVPSRSASKYGARGRSLFALQDATIAASFAWLQAVASDLAACWVGAFDDEAVKSTFRGSIGPDWRPIALLPVGYAAE